MRRPSDRVVAQVLELYQRGELSPEFTHWLRYEVRILPPAPGNGVGGVSFLDSYSVHTVSQRARIQGGIPEETARSRSRREEKRGQLEKFETVGDIRGWKRTGKNLESPHVIFAWLGIAEFSAITGKRILSRGEFRETLTALEEAYGSQFDAPGLMRARWCWWSEEELSRVRVDLRKRFDASQFVEQLEVDLEKLTARAPGWALLLADQGLSFSIVTPEPERVSKIKKEVSAAGLPARVRVTVVPWLKLAHGQEAK